uniref:Uncharacterized protein n=1 Tax=Hydrodictyon reticulatum TaxID=3107 RepID=A0A1W5RN00_HYDRE|nr:hypothetical protein [Hydrodictyon reticulatum]AQU64585.1 hypothetical protein [Hydrodictyon reticulatum]
MHHSFVLQSKTKQNKTKQNKTKHYTSSLRRSQSEERATRSEKVGASGSKAKQRSKHSVSLFLRSLRQSQCEGFGEAKKRFGKAEKQRSRVAQCALLHHSFARGLKRRMLCGHQRLTKGNF